MSEEEMLNNQEVSENPISQHRFKPQDEAELRQMHNRLNRMVGQLNGVGRMLDENRFCGDILIQISAIDKALQSFGFMVLQSHIRSCVIEEVKSGNTEIMDEMIELMKRLK